MREDKSCGNYSANNPRKKPKLCKGADNGGNGVKFGVAMKHPKLTALFLAVVIFAAAPVRAESASPPSSSAVAADGRAPLIAAFGDSLSAGYGLAPENGFAPALQRALAALGIRAEVQNHAVAGDTTDDALARADWMLREKPDIVILEFGANDMLRAFPPDFTRANLDAVMQKIRDSGARVILAGMLAPLNSGQQFAQAFNAVFPALAAKHQAPLYPFFLAGVALKPELNLPDGLHPNAKGVEVIAKKIAPLVAKTVKQWRGESQ